MSQDDELQQPASTSDEQTDDHAAATGVNSNSHAGTSNTAPPTNSKRGISVISNFIAEAFSLWLRMVGGPAEPEFKDGKVTQDNNTLFRLLIFVVVAASTLTGASAISIKGLKPEALSEMVLQSRPLLLPLVITAFVALIYSWILGPLCQIRIDFNSTVRVFALLGLPFMVFWAMFIIWDPHRFPLIPRLWLISLVLLCVFPLVNIGRGIYLITNCSRWKIGISMILPLIGLSGSFLLAAANQLHNTSSTATNSNTQPPK